jgi:NhaA family Na+:H+ antiporter
MATDIAFAVTVLAVVGSRVPPRLKLFLLTLAIVDDIGAIIVIALFYGHGLTGVYPLLGTAVALCVPARAKSGGRAPTERLEEVFHPIVSFGVIPLFALANAGIEFGHGALSDGLTSRITYGVVLGLCIGKLVGIAGATALAVRIGAGRVPEGSTGRDRAGVAALGGIGFTVALFVSDLAFGGRSDALSDAKLGVFVASLVSAAIGAVIFKVGKAPGTSRQS